MSKILPAFVYNSNANNYNNAGNVITDTNNTNCNTDRSAIIDYPTTVGNTNKEFSNVDKFDGGHANFDFDFGFGFGFGFDFGFGFNYGFSCGFDYGFDYSCPYSCPYNVTISESCLIIYSTINIVMLNNTGSPFWDR